MIILTSLQIGLPRTHDTPEGPWHTAYVKEPVRGPVWLSKTGLAGDGVGNTRHHGGEEMAVCAYPGEHLLDWREELPHLALGPGAFGENFTLTGVKEQTACVGDVFEVGETLVQISKPREPCPNIARRWGQPDFVKRVQRSGRTGWYMRVLRQGHVAAGMALQLVERPHPEWTVARVCAVWSNRGSDPGAALELALCEALSPPWRERLRSC